MKDLGIALLVGKSSPHYRVKTLRNGKKPHELLGQAKSTIVEPLEKEQPDIVVIERPFFAKTRRSALLVFLVEELRARARADRIALSEYGPREVLQACSEIPKRRSEISLGL